MHLAQLLAAAGTTAASSGPVWQIVSVVITGIVALLSFGWMVTKDLRRDKHQTQTDHEKATSNYIELSLAGLRELTESLQEEVKRLETERDRTEKAREDWEERAVAREFAAEQREQDLLRQIGRLRQEVRQLRQVLADHGIPVPQTL